MWLARVLRGGIARLLALYTLGIVVLQVMWRTTALEIWWIELLNLFGLWLYLPLPFALLLAPIARPRKVSFLLVAPLVFFGWEYGSLFVPQAAASEGTPLRVMTWNILYRNWDTDAIAATVYKQAPDILAVQELSPAHVGPLQALLGREYPYSALDPGGPGGLGLWSRHPIVQSAPSDGRRMGCSCQQVVLDVGGERVQVINVHPVTPQYAFGGRYLADGAIPVPLPRWFSTERQEPAIAALVAAAGAGDDRLIVAGDFNTGDRHQNYWRLRRELRDAYREAGSGFGLTFPNGGEVVRGLELPAMLRIDYIFYGDGIDARNAHTVAAPSSDHRAVVADLLLTPRSEVNPTMSSFKFENSGAR